MQGFLQSPFLQALGYAIANSLWQVALLWLVVVAIKNVGKLSSAGKYFVAVTAEFAGFIWFIFTFQYYYSKCTEALSGLSAPLDQSSVLQPSINSVSSAILYITIKGEQLLPYLSVAYLCIMLFLVMRLSRAFYYTRKIRHHGLEKPGIEWRLFIRKTAGYLGIKKEVKIYFSHLIKSPVTLGFLKPLILVPVASINHLSTDQLEALLLHELAHIKRADYLVNIIQSIVELLLFFNPFVQLLGGMIKKERENSCDDWVLQFQYNPAMYAEALLTIACIPTRSNLAMNATGNKHDLLSRVKRMLNKQEKSYHYRNQVFALMLITLMLTTVAWFNPPAKYHTAHAVIPQQSQKILVEPLAMTADNPLFSPMYFFSKPMREELDKAVSDVADKVTAAAPEIQKKATGTLATVTPLALEKLQQAADMNIDLTGAMDQATKALTAIGQAASLLKIAPSENLDTASLRTLTLNSVRRQLDNTDWKKVADDLRKASAQINTLSGNQLLKEKTSREIRTTLDATMAQLDALKKEKAVSFEKILNVIDQSVKQSVDVQELYQNRQLRKSTEQKKREQQQKSAHQKQLKTYSDMEGDDAINPVIDFDLQPVMQPSEQVYVPTMVKYSNTIADSLTTAIIIVCHDPANDSSHVKHITVDITGNDGSRKSYDFTVEVYQ